jgi:NAD(P)H-nitrite reductase large subunit
VEQGEQDMATRHVVVGGSIAGTQAAEVIRSLRPEDPVTVIAEEERPFYMRPLLADFVAGRIEETRLWRTFESTAKSKNIAVLTGRRVTEIDRQAKTVGTADGEKAPYDRLLVATGAKPRLPKIPGIGLQGVTPFSEYGDAARVRQWAKTAKRAVVVGRGLQGVELTRALRLRGLDVTMIVPDESPWFPALFQVKGEMIEQALEEHGVKVIALDAPAEVVGEGDRAIGVKTREGREVEGEIVGFALDQKADVEFLVGSGISLADGIVVDERLQSTDENVYAAGDVAQVESEGKRRPIGYGWMRALTQGEAAARSMCGETVAVEVGDEADAQALYGMGLLARWS